MPIPKTPAEPIPIGVTPIEVAPQIVSKPFRSSLIDSKVDPISSLLLYVEGSFWETDYYSQVVGKDEELSPHQPGQMAIYQQYYLIKKMRIKVQTPLSTAQDTESTTFTRTGAAILPPFVKPNNGDTFIADIGDGKVGVFNVTNTKRNTTLSQSTYEIEYTLVRYYTPDIKADLDQKVVQTAYYQQNMLLYGKNPVVAEQDVVTRDQIADTKQKLLNRFLMGYFDKEYRILKVPGQDYITYDHYLTVFILNMFNKSEHSILKMVRFLNIDGARMMDKMNLWSVLLNQNDSMSDAMSQVMYLVSTMDFSKWPSFDGVVWSGVDYVVYPYYTSGDFDNSFLELEDPAYHIKLNTARDNMLTSLQDLFPSATLNGFSFSELPAVSPEHDYPSIPPLYHPVGLDEFYVFSRHFYHKTAGQSTLELLTNAYLMGKPFDIQKVFDICKEVPHMGKLEQFYYIPVLLMLLIVSERSNLS